VWYTALEPDAPQTWFLPDDHPFGLDDVVVLTLAIDPTSLDPDFTTSFAMTGVFDRPDALGRPATGDPYVDRSGLEKDNPLGHVIMNLPEQLPSFGMRHPRADHRREEPPSEAHLAQFDTWDPERQAAGHGRVGRPLATPGSTGPSEPAERCP
jgi:hypothetical protein